MLRHAFIAAALCLAATPAFACTDYNGRIDLEGKRGNKRDIGEASVFLPVACTPNRLLFSDIRFRADDSSNREGNLGLGARLMREQGILGVYGYFDRKKSGETDKYYNQITAGTEWLAQNWEVRGNAYVPLTGSKTLASGITTSAPYLAGSGIFIDSAGFAIKEAPLYGADIEAGARIPDTKLWLYGGAFSFHHDDAPNVSGIRARAKYDLTETLALTAEGQYDGERGRQGWLGARLSIPFGKIEKRAGLQARMTQSPVRDVDIVTQTQKKATGPKTTAAVLNTESGTAQRVIYVDNRASAGGDGSLEKPFNTLGDAQAVLADYDVVYVYRGDGTTAGLDQGFVIDKNDVSLIGEGSALTYGGYLLKKAGDKPVITNAQPLEDGINVTGRNTAISGVAIDDSSQNALHILSLAGQNMGFVRLDNVSISAPVASGVRILADGVGSVIDEIVLRNISVTDAGGIGLRLFAEGNGAIGDVFLEDVNVRTSGGGGIFVSAGSSAEGPGTIDSLTLARVSSVDNGVYGLQVRSREIGSVIGNARLAGGDFSGNVTGVILTTAAQGVLSAFDMDRIKVSGNSGEGIRLVAASASVLDAVYLRNSDVISNGQAGVTVTDNTVGTYEVNLGGNNRFFGNGYVNPVLYGDINVDLDDRPEPLDARGNWWGQDTGPAAGQIRIGASPNGGSADSSGWLTEDPRP